MSTKILVVGQGFVGGSLTTVFSERGIEPLTYDKAEACAPGGKRVVLDWVLKQDADKTSYLQQVVVYAEQQPEFSGIFFVAVPTPMNEDGSADLSIVKSVLDDIAVAPNENKHQRVVVIKSTIPPGTTEDWNEELRLKDLNTTVIFNPEFLREATALDDMRNQDRIILGGPRPQIDVVRDLYRTAFPTVNIYKTSSTNAELVKYFTNCFLATKVSFANEMYQLCEALTKEGLDVDYDRTVELATLDKRLGTSHWQVPGPMPADDGTKKLLPGFSGSCLVENTVVQLAPQGLINITKLVQDVVITDRLMSANHLLSQLDEKELEKLSARHYSGIVYEFTVGNNVVTCTPEHVIPVQRDGNILLVEAQDVLETDELFCI